MSLEAKIEALTEQVTQLTDAVTVLKNVLLEQLNSAKRIPYEELDPPACVPPVNDEAQIDAEKAGNEKSKPTTDTSPPSSNESRTVTYDDVKNVTIAVSKIDKAKAVAGLARFGVQTAKSLTEDQWLKYVTYMEKVQSGKLDPESSHE